MSIPSVMIGQADGASFRAEPAGSVGVTLRTHLATASSYRWLIGEDAFAIGTIRDMWNPNCFGHPGKVSDLQYWCTKSDAGGVHVNSGIPNHAFALLVDGGAYNGETIAPIGVVKAAHLYWRAMDVYQLIVAIRTLRRLHTMKSNHTVLSSYPNRYLCPFPRLSGDAKRDNTIDCAGHYLVRRRGNRRSVACRATNVPRSTSCS